MNFSGENGANISTGSNVEIDAHHIIAVKLWENSVQDTFITTNLVSMCDLTAPHIHCGKREQKSEMDWKISS